ncbi:MAG: hypothetical protein Q7V63_00140 [Gammaproteobacteria bacterium]|nr:hypothetical protein [Gammaproteobacteria bacterium]
MLDHTLQKIEDVLTSAPGLTEDKKQQLLGLVAELKHELSHLSETEQDNVLKVVKSNQLEVLELSYPRVFALAKDLSVAVSGLGV